MMTPPIDVVTGGEAMGLLLADGPTPLRQARRFVRSVAGSESNVAVALARLGFSVTFSGRVGSDAPGQWVRDTLRAEGIDVTALREDSGRPTGLLMRDCPAGRPVSVAYYRQHSAASALSPADVDCDLFGHARLLFVSGITAALSPSAAQFLDRAIEAAQSGGAHVVFDLNVRLSLAPAPAWRDILHRYRRQADTLFIGADEAAQIGEDAQPDQLLGGRTAAVILKRGIDGASSITAGEVIEMPARRVPVADPVGAGDALCAGWISGWLRGNSARDCLHEAITCASLVVATPSDTDGLPAAAERDRILQPDGADVVR